MVNKFMFWLESIVEDDPLPDEINCIVFKVNQSGDYKSLELLGFEKKVDFAKMTYNPLEAQFYSLQNINKKSTQQIIYNLKYLIEEAFSNLWVKNQFKKRKIYLFINGQLQFLFLI